MITPIPFNIAFQVYTQNQQSIISQCAEITFINNGTTDLTLNNSLVLKPTQSLSIGSEQYEKDTTIYTISFSGVTGNQCTIIRKYYNSYPGETDAELIKVIKR